MLYELKQFFPEEKDWRSRAFPQNRCSRTQVIRQDLPAQNCHPGGAN